MSLCHFLPLVSSLSVFPIWIIEQFLPYPWLVEESIKWIIIILLAKQRPKNAIWIVVLAGLSFGATEAVFYQIDNLVSLSSQNIVLRFFLTVPMHIITFVIMYLGISKNKLTAILSVLVAFGIHFLFNFSLL